jgi:hypothetical protein
VAEMTAPRATGRATPPVRHTHGLSRSAAKDRLVDAMCEICGYEARVNDHNHSTGKLRGTLCHYCNSMLGFAEDNPGYLVAGALYLERYGGLGRR